MQENKLYFERAYVGIGPYRVFAEKESSRSFGSGSKWMEKVCKVKGIATPVCALARNDLFPDYTTRKVQVMGARVTSPAAIASRDWSGSSQFSP